jgi:hypothetical protein
MVQTRLGSLIEALANVVVGFSINYLLNIVILNWVMDKHVTLSENFYIGVMFTVVSVARSYVLRRSFNGWLHGASERLASRIRG